MSKNFVTYLTDSDPGMRGGLSVAIQSLPAKMKRAPAKEWEGALKGLASRGQIKQAEIDDSGILGWLQGSVGVIERDELMKAVDRQKITIKEVELGTPMYRDYSHAKYAPVRGSRYAEVLLIANSERDNMDDRIAEIEWEMEDINLDMERMSSDPLLIVRLSTERSNLMKKRLTAFDFQWSHFVRQDLGREGKNLVAHARELKFDDVFLVEEIQSDWGQKGRRLDWNGVPRGPFVTDTKLWAGLAMRRMMQRAATDPQVNRFFWIRGSMRNGGVQVTKDKLDEFYLKTMAGIVDRVIKPAGQKCRLESLHLGEHLFAEVPCFDMTSEVRELLLKELPLYSLSQLLPRPVQLDEARKQFFLRRAGEMIGSAKSVRLVDHLYDVANGREVAGSYINGLVQASLRAEDLQGVLDHECFHFGMDKLFSESEKRMVRRSFARGSELNRRVVLALQAQGNHRAAAQCVDAEEAAAHAFALWNHGAMDLRDSPATGFFRDFRVLIGDVMSWIRRVALEECVDTPQQLFESFSKGEYSVYAKEQVYRGPDVRRAEAVRQ